jgi:hypothetical protein
LQNNNSWKRISLLVISLSSVGVLFIILRLNFLTTLTNIEPPAWGPLLDLSRLSESTKNAVVILLLMPLGALITSIIHNIVGWKTFSHFAPTLLAVSFIHARFVHGLIIFTALLTVGFAFRVVVDRLKLSMRPRVSLVLLSISLTLVFIVSLLESMGERPWRKGGGILLPMIALTLLIERFYRNARKKGYTNSFRKFLGTMTAAVISLFVFRIEAVQQAFLRYPELELFIAAGLFLVGLYKPKGENNDHDDG